MYKTTAEKTSGGKTVTKSVITYGAETQYAYPTVEEAYSNIGQPNQQIVKTSTAYDMGTGRVIEKRDGNQNATLYAYDAAGRLTKETQPNRTNAKGEVYSEVTDYNYYNQTSGNFDSVNTGTEVLKVDSIHTLTNLSNQNAVKTYANVLYNGLGLTLLEEHFDENTGKWVFTQYHYDDQGRPVYSMDPAGNTLTVSYDAWGRQNRATNANGDLIVNDYSLKARTSTSYIQDKSTGEKLENPLSQDLYTYVHNNPLLYSDPSVHTPIVGDSPYDTQPPTTVKGTVVKIDNAVLTEELVIMIATIYGEAANSSETSWEVIANVMMNRVETGEWKKYTSVLEIIKHTGFDAYTQKNQPYKEAMDYLESRGGKGSKENTYIEKLIQTVVDVYFNKREDITGGAVLYYSPKAQAALHNKYPKSYKENPPWNVKLLTQVKIKGLENDDFKFYKYK
ncbi:RHS repeat domain-containing protein [Paenibacillus sp. P46E]|uniref:RHS repeat domain-containing protein n=1 Tax=Paenibacillus sp. P46E TaxID=1349436 RepID=UPI002115FEB7|nr:RHS repeat domain-containing protein [Paenibacillus sp. P46E]